MSLGTALFSVLSLPLLSTAAPARLAKRTISQDPVIKVVFPDPSFINVPSGSGEASYYAFATNNGAQNIPVATSSDFLDWVVQDGIDALPDPGPWTNSDDPAVWAPDVVQLADDSFVLYYSATISDNSMHCIGAASSSTPLGPYTPQAEPLICPNPSTGGAIDASSFLDTDGTRYLLYKLDGNHIQATSDSPETTTPVPTPILIQKISSTDGVTFQGPPQQILVNDPSTTEGPIVEAPSLAVFDGVYYLFYSSNWYNSPHYDVKYAISRNGILNDGDDYVKAVAPLLKTGLNTIGEEMVAPGGLHVGESNGADSALVVFHSSWEGDAKKRVMWSGQLNVDTDEGTASLIRGRRKWALKWPAW